jgi:hypothetical protein
MIKEPGTERPKEQPDLIVVQHWDEEVKARAH